MSPQVAIAQRRNFIPPDGAQLLEPLPDLPRIKFLMVAGVVARPRTGGSISLSRHDCTALLPDAGRIIEGLNIARVRHQSGDAVVGLYGDRS